MEQVRIELDQEQVNLLESLLEQELVQIIKDIEEENNRHRQVIETLTSKQNSSKGVLTTIQDGFRHKIKADLDNKVANFRRSTQTKPDVIQAGEYNSNAAWLDKFKFVLFKKNRALSLKEALDEIRTYEPIGQGMEAKFRSIQSKLSGSLKSQINTNRLKRIKSKESGEFIYGFIDWFDEDGVLKNQYL